MVAKTRSTRKRKKPVFGDVFEVKTASGFGYFQYVGWSKLYGELICVFTGTHKERPESFESILAGPEAFLTFYPIPVALSRGLVELVHHQALPERFRIFPMMRDGIDIPRSGGRQKWKLFDGEHFGEFVELTPDLAKLSVAGVSGHALLQNKIESGYRPEDEV